MTGERPQPRRLFSATALALGLTLLAVLGIRVLDMALKRQAIRGIESLGGAVYFSDEQLYDPALQRGTKSLVKEFFLLRTPVYVGMSRKQVTDAAIDDYVLALSSITTLQMTDVAVSDAALARLARLSHLQTISCTRDPRHQEILSTLEEETRVEVTDVPLDDLVAFLIDYHDVPIVIDKPALAAAGLNGALTITYKTVTPMSLGAALDDLLAPHGLAWIVRAGAIAVTTRPVADKARHVTQQLKRDLPNLKEVKIDSQ